MPEKYLNSAHLGMDEDWDGNSAAFRCPKCGKIFLVNAHPRLHMEGPPGESGYRKCPKCRGSLAHIKGGKKPGGMASITW